jgi:hypothetical protein
LVPHAYWNKSWSLLSNMIGATRQFKNSPKIKYIKYWELRSLKVHIKEIMNPQKESFSSEIVFDLWTLILFFLQWKVGWTRFGEDSIDDEANIKFTNKQPLVPNKVSYHPFCGIMDERRRRGRREFRSPWNNPKRVHTHLGEYFLVFVVENNKPKFELN